ncbi:MAG: hypothetical protein GX604_02965 [Actinobacteria bacterium]|nr:hypothetical protein [Actinomycetota bacterium]
MGQTTDVTVTLSPDSPGTNVTVSLSCLEGKGEARFWPSGQASTTLTASATLTITGVTASSTASNLLLRVLLAGEALVSNRFTIIRVDMVPDWDHDRDIDSSDENQATASNPFHFWNNDDDDDGDISNGDDDLPGRSGGLFGSADYGNGDVDGRSDLLDFFPVWLDLHDALNVLPTTDGAEYKLSHADEALRFVYTDLTKSQAGNYLTTEGSTYGPSFNQDAFEADTIEVSSSGVTLSTDFLDKIAANENKGILMMEGAGDTTAPLVLEVWKDGNKGCEAELPIELSTVEDMYRWINVRDVAGGSESRDTDTAEPDNYPDSYCNGKQFIFVHGYNVHEEGARAWNSEMFKRLYQSGSRAMFTAVTWHGNDGQIGWIPFVPDVTPDYYVNVEHAFETASNLVSIISSTNVPGTKYIAGHSLGNMVVSSALKDQGLSVSAYFMLNAAVAMEAYDAGVSHRDAIRHPDWQNHTNLHLWASEWHQLFPTNDGRGELSWRGEFGSMSSGFNYYSSEEDVLANANSNMPSFFDLPEQSWVMQEMRKGTTIDWIEGNAEAGWGFNDDYEDLTVAEANALPDSTLQTNSFFRHFDDEDLYGTNGSAVAQEPATYRQLLADAIPALSNPAGRNSLGSSAGQGNRDLDGYRRGAYPDGWPDRWKHSDLTRIAYPYNHGAFDKIVDDGSLE